MRVTARLEMGMLSLFLQLILLSSHFGIVTSECEDGTCKETRDMDLAEEENFADRYLRRSNELLAGFSKDLTEEKRQKRSEGRAENLGDEIRALEKLSVRYLDTRSPIQKEKIRLQLLAGINVLCPELGITGPNPVECRSSPWYRNLDGSCNNLVHPAWGKASYPIRREFPADYDDGVSEFCLRRPGNPGPRNRLPTAREVVIAVTGSDLIFNPINPSQLVMHFGQFIDHDLVHVPVENVTCRGCKETEVCFPIGVPRNDPVFAELQCLDFRRSRPFLDANCYVATRSQENQITSYLDSSNVYGSSDEDGEELRDTAKGKGQMKVNEEPIDLDHLPVLPHDKLNNECTKGASVSHCGKGGDVRAAEQPGLTAIHTILVREHNRIAKELHKMNGHWTDDRLYHEAKRIVNGIYQHIIFNEWLPIIIGPGLMDAHALSVGRHSPYAGYFDTIDATIFNVFATAAFRFGHSFVPSHLKRVNSKFDEIYTEIPLREAFFNGTYVYDFVNGGVDSVLLGMVDENLLKVDRHFSEDIVTFLFAEEGASFGMDLVSLNIQRGRDHGLPSYAEIFNFCHGYELTSFNGMTHTYVNTINRIKTVYDRVQDIDPFIGMVTEEPIRGAAVGPTAGCIIAHQFSALKYGDRFWYENTEGRQAFTDRQLREIQLSSYARLLCDNLANKGTVQPYAFMMPQSSPRPRYDSFVEFSRREKYPLEDGRLPGLSNQRVSCSDYQAIPKLNLNEWRDIIY